MRKLILLLTVCVFFVAGPVSAKMLIGEATFQDASYNFASEGNLSFNGTGGYYGVINGSYDGSASGPVWNPPTDDTTAHFELFLDLDLLGDNSSNYTDTINLGTHLWSDMKAAFNTCFDYVSMSSGIFAGLKKSCFDSNILNTSDIANIGSRSFNGTVKLFMATTAVPTPGTLALLLGGFGLIGFGAAKRHRQSDDKSMFGA